jgi:hypothetical protein
LVAISVLIFSIKVPVIREIFGRKHLTEIAEQGLSIQEGKNV